MTKVRVIKQEDKTKSKDKQEVRVAAYCRVSSLPQEESYESQVEHFTSTISAHTNWKLVSVYGDEGVTGLNTRHRNGFKKMLRDGRNKKFDLLLVKSISRLGRNTVDLLQAVRDLKSAGVSVFFEKENISTDESAGELMLTLFSAFAQMESESISANVKIGLSYKMQRGEWSVAYSNFLGYDRTKEGEIVVNNEEAKTVRLIYELFLNGYSLEHISRKLIAKERKTGMGTLKWNKGSVQRILCNRKYSGDVELQLTVMDDFLSKRRVVNTGQAPKYLVIDGIPPIISRQTWYIAQGEMQRRKKSNNSKIAYYKNIFTGKLKCYCGANYNRHNARGKYVWKCYKRIHDECNAKILKEEEIKQAVLDATQLLYDMKPKVNLKEVPLLSEESSLEERINAATINLENVWNKRLSNFLKDIRPQKYRKELMNLIERIEFRNYYKIYFFTGQIIEINKKEIPIMIEEM